MAATASTQKEGGPHAKGPFPPFPPEHFGSQLVWFAIAFGLLYLLLARFVLPRIASILRSASARRWPSEASISVRRRPASAATFC